MKETDLQDEIQEWVIAGGLIMDCGISGSCALEYKIVKTDLTKTPTRKGRYYFRSLEDHQLDTLLAGVREGCGVYWKPSDLVPGRKPCDALWISEGRGLLIVGFWDDGRLNGGRGLRWYVLDVLDYMEYEEAALERGVRGMSEVDVARLSVGKVGKCVG